MAAPVVYNDSTYQTVIIFRGPLTEAIITDIELGVTAKGYAKLNETDEYDKDFGEYLALVRATSRLLSKLEKRAVKNGAYR